MTKKEAILYLQGYKATSDSAQVHTAMDMAIQALETLIKHEETYEWCRDCKEFDTEAHCCHRWNKAIKRTVEEIKRYYDETD